MVPELEIQLGENSGSVKFIQDLIDKWDRELVLNSKCFELVVVHAKPLRTIFLFNQEHET